MEKILLFQKKVEAIKKDSVNPFFKSNYFDINSLLAEVKPILNELGLVISQPLETKYAQDKIYNVLSTDILDATTGESILSSSIMLPDIQDPQKIGSAITYYRRYSLQSLLGLQSDDDDANVASNKPKF